MPLLRRRIEAGNDAGTGKVPGGEAFAGWGKQDLPRGQRQERSADPRSLLPVCGNERCRASWLRLWWRRQTPRLEGSWACSPPCLEEMVRAVLLRESQGGDEAPRAHRHRVPLGLMLYSQGVITESQLRAAVEAQREAAARGEAPRRIGRWLMDQGSLREEQLVRALSLQWNCPLFSFERLDPARAAQLMPRLLVETCGAVPLRRTASGRVLVAFEDGLDHCVSRAMEQVHGVPVEAGLMRAREFRRVRETLVAAKFPRLRMIEVANRNVLVRALVQRMEEVQPMDAALVRVREYYWLRMWKTLDRAAAGAEDLLAVEATFS